MRIPGSGEDNPVCHTFHGPNHPGIILILWNSNNNSAIPNPKMSQDFLYILTAGGIDTGIQQNKRLGTQDFHASRPVQQRQIFPDVWQRKNCGFPAQIRQHIHNELAQWYFPLPGSEFIYTAGGEEVKMTGGDLSFTPTGFWHGSKVEAGRQCDYIWFEMCIDGYPGEIK